MKSINIRTALLLTLAAATLASCGEDDGLTIPMPQHMTAGHVMSASTARAGYTWNRMR